MKKLAKHLFCPVCKKHGLSVSEHIIDEPQFFPEGIIEIHYKCESCGFSATDVYPLKKGKPSKITFKVESLDELGVRVVKSSTATLTIPEIGGTIKPGEIAEGYITNVEGVLERFEKVFASEPAALSKLRQLKQEANFTLVLEDPGGNSRILSAKAVSEPI